VRVSCPGVHTDDLVSLRDVQDGHRDGVAARRDPSGDHRVADDEVASDARSSDPGDRSIGRR
jgi:hypothetical protein